MIQLKTKQLLSKGDKFIIAKDGKYGRKYYAFMVVGVTPSLDGGKHVYLVIHMVTP